MSAPSVFHPRVFISHSSKDSMFAGRLANDLRSRLENHQAVWYDQSDRDRQFGKDLEGGEDWQRRIWTELMSRNVCIIILSPDAIDSLWVRDEVEMAWRRKNDVQSRMVIIPVMYRQCKPEELHGFLGNVQTISFVASPGIAHESSDLSTDEYARVLEDLWAAVTLGRTQELSRNGEPPRDYLKYMPVPEYFVGRTDELGALCDRLRRYETASVMAVNGMGGIGKSTLAAKAVHLVANEGVFPDGVAFVSCEGKSNETHVVGILKEIISRFVPDHRLPETDDADLLADDAQAQLAGKRALIVLDNVEPGLPIEPIATTLRATGVALLMTARSTFLRRVVPREGSVELGALTGDESLELFIRIYGPSAWSQLGGDQKSAGMSIVSRLSGHTYAIEMLGAYASELGRDLTALQHELIDPDRILTLQLPQHMPKSVGAVFIPSYRSLTEDAQRLFAAFASFPALEFGRQAALALAQTLDLRDPRAALDLLVHRRLISTLIDEKMPKIGDRERLRMHPLVRDFATSERRKGPDRGGVWTEQRRRAAEMTVCQFYATYVNQVVDVALEADEENIYGSLRRARARQQDDIVVRMCIGLRRYWRVRDQRNLALDFLVWGIEAAERSQFESSNQQIVLQLSELQMAYADMLRREGNMPDAENIYKMNLALRRSLRDRRGEQFVLSQLGLLAEGQEQWDQADDYFHQVRDLARERGDQRFVASSLVHLARAAIARRQWDMADVYLRDAVLMNQQLGYREGEGRCQWTRGRLAVERQRWDVAEEAFRQSLAIAVELSNHEDQGATLSQLGRIAIKQQRWDQAQSYYEQAFGYARECGDRQAMMICLDHLIMITQARQRRDEEQIYVRQRGQMSKSWGEKRRVAVEAAQMGRMALALSQYDEAERSFTRALQIARQLHNQGDEMADLTQLGQLALMQRKWDQAELYLGQARVIMRRLGNDERADALVMTLARLAFEQRRWEESANYYELALTAAREHQSTREIGIILRRLGRIGRERGEWDNALKYYRQALELSRSEADIHNEFVTLSQIGRVEAARERWDEAEPYLQTALHMAREHGFEQDKAANLAQLGRVAVGRARQSKQNDRYFREAAQYYEAALEISRRLLDWLHIGINLGQLYIIAEAQHEHEAAARFAQEALDIGRENNDHVMQAINHTRLGRVYRGLNQLDKAYQHFHAAWQLNHGQTREEARALSNLGHIALDLGQLDVAEQHFQQALNIGAQSRGGDLETELTAHHDLGLLEIMRWKWQLAQQYTQQALDIATQLKKTNYQGRELTQLARIAMARWQWEEADQLLQRSLAIAQSQNSQLTEAVILALLGRSAIGRQAWDEAEVYYTRTLTINRANNEGADADRHEGANLSQLGRIALERHQWQEARDYYQQALTIAEKWDDTYGAGTDLAQLGVIEWAHGHLDEAERLMREALRRIRIPGPRPPVATGEATILLSLGRLLVKRESTRPEGCMLMRQAQQTYAQMDVPEAQVVQRELISLGCVD